MSALIACMMCGSAGGGKALAISIAAIFGLMLLGTIVMLVRSVLGGDFRDDATRFRPLDAEAGAGSGADPELTRGRTSRG